MGFLSQRSFIFDYGTFFGRREKYNAEGKDVKHRTRPARDKKMKLSRMHDAPTNFSAVTT